MTNVELPPPLAELLGITTTPGQPPQSPQTPLFSKFHSWMTTGLLGQDDSQDANINRLRHQCRTGNPFPLIARLWPSILVPPDHPHAAVLRANLQQIADADVPDSIKSICLDESNPTLRIDWWQAIILAAVFDLSIGEIALAGATGIGKGFASSVSVCLWYEVFRESRIHLTGPNSEKCRTGILGEIVQWRGQQSICCEGAVRAESIHHNKRHYIEVLNPSIDSKNADEKFSGAHGKNTLYLFDEACHDDQTEVLTDSGWKFFKDVVDGDMLLTMDRETHESHYVNPIHIHISHFEGEMWRYNVRGSDFCVSPGHRIYYRNSKGNWRLRPIEDMPYSGMIPRSIKRTVDDVKTFTIPAFDGRRKKWPPLEIDMDLWCEFLGWYFSEGHLAFQRSNKDACTVGITNKSIDVLDRIVFIARQFGLNPRIYTGSSNPQVFINCTRMATYLLQFGRGCLNKRLPDFLRRLSPRQMKIFLKAFCAGDGYIRRGKKPNHSDHFILYTSSKQLADGLHELCLLAGYSSTLEKRNLSGVTTIIEDHVATSSCDGYVILSRKPTEICFRRSKLRKMSYSGMIYCASVPPTELLFTRRNGRCLWSGNTAMPSSWVENARRNSQLIMALGNPRTLSGWFRGLFDQMDPAKRVQVLPGQKGQRLCMQIGGEQCLNVRYRRLRVPVAPQGGFEVDPAVHF